MFGCEGLASRVLDNLCACKLTLVPDQHLVHLIRGKPLDVAYPALDVLEALFVSHIIHQHDPHCAPIVSICERPKSLLTRGIPNLQLEFPAFYLDGFDLEVNPYSSNEIRVERVIAKPH